jgi:hypothetical protein
VGLEQNISSFVPYQIGQVFVMVFQGWGLLIARAVLTVQDVGDRQWQYALGGFFQGTVEDLVHFMLCHQSRSGHAQQPE